MFENPADTTIVADTVPFYLLRDSASGAPRSHAEPLVFSGYKVIDTDSANISFKIDAASLSTSIGKQSLGLPGKPFGQSQFWGSIFFLLFASCIMLFALFFRREGQLLTRNFKNLIGFGNRNKTVYKEQITTSEVWGEIFLFFQAVLLISMLIFTGLWNLGIDAQRLKTQFFLFGGILISLSFFLVVKYGIYRIMGFTLPELEMDHWSKKYLWAIEISGILSFCPSIFFIYLPAYREITLILLLVIIFVNYALILVNLLGIFVKNKIGFLYFIVYLCAVEIAPFFVLYKGVVSLINHAGSIL